MTEYQSLNSAADDSPSAIPDCPKCQGPMWDNRQGKRNPRAPDFKCKDRGCDGVVWPPRGATGAATPVAAAPAAAATPSSVAAPHAAEASDGTPSCPICGGPMWDDRATKRNPRAPDFKCKNKPRERGGPGCEGVIWPPRAGAPSAPSQRARPAGGSASRPASSGGQAAFDAPPAYRDVPPPDDPPPFDDDDLPF